MYNNKYMKKTTNTLLSVALLSILCCSLSGCNNKVTLLELRPELVRDFIDATDEITMCEILADEPSYLDEQVGCISADDIDCRVYKIEFSETKSFEKSFSFTTHNSQIFTCGLIPGREYFYRISDDDNPNKYLKNGHIKAEEVPGVFYTVDGMNNVRDLGGWSAENGKTIKFDKIIRGGRTNRLNDEPYYSDLGYEILTNSLGIKGEIDLRHSGDIYGQTHNFIDEEYPYLNASFFCYSEILPGFMQTEPMERHYNAKTPANCKQIFSFLANEDNYPIYIHCNAGADRTGTICMLIEGLLGVSVDDIYKEFELTSFSPYGKRWRSNIDFSTFTFDDSGVMQDDSSNYVGMGKCVKTLWETYAPNGTYQEAVTNYLKNVRNVTDEEITSVKNIMLKA